MKPISYSVLAIAVRLAGCAGIPAQTDEADLAINSGNVITLTEWQYEPLYESGGLRAEHLISEEVFGPGGNEIGNVEDAIINAQGQMVAIIAEVGGFWDIADTHIVVPWSQVTLVPEGFAIPVTETNYEEYALFSDTAFVTQADVQQTHPVTEGVATGPELWNLTDLLDDYATLSTGVGYGYVDDVIFSRDGEILAVIIDSSVATLGYGTYAYPFYGIGWEPYDNVYTLPYGAEDVGVLEPFEYDMFDGFFY